MFFIFLGTDNPDCFDLRRDTKSRHSAYLDAATGSVAVLMSGPTLDSEGREAGSVMILEAPDTKSVIGFFETEPYHLAGLFGATDVRAWNWKRGNPYL
ncbi:YciI family protein [Sphingopyxis sp.]|uniref:YciI family protein n=1 Tax=Sphingopyxis sp. TaxID=1908224 RepID=UPI002D798805|nr:YciI family protein [Sphingopyxis sp.]HET6526353.1 YciI family protein [Sphingopyxis sp.]